MADIRYVEFRSIFEGNTCWWQDDQGDWRLILKVLESGMPDCALDIKTKTFVQILPFVRVVAWNDIPSTESGFAFTKALLSGCSPRGLPHLKHQTAAWSRI